MEGQGQESGSGTLLVLDPKPFKPFRSKDEYLYAMKEDLSEWFYCLYRIEISVENFFEVLDSGVMLCEHAVSVQNFAQERRIQHAEMELRSYFIREIPDGGIPCKQGAKPKTFQARDNISNFITWCRKLGIPQVLLFETDDLVLRKNERSVVLCLLEVARIGAKLGMLAPVLVQMEEEIDAELAGEPPPQIITCDLRSLDEMVRELVGRCTCPAQFPIIQVGDGKYKIGDSQTLIFVRILRNHVMVRVGGGWDTLENYLDKHDPCRCGFRGHRNPASSGQYVKPQPRRISAPNVQHNSVQTPRSNRSMSVTGPNVSPNKQLSVYTHMRSPSPEPPGRQRLSPRTSSGSVGNISERSTSSKLTSRPASPTLNHSTVKKDSDNYSNTFRYRSHSPSPLSDSQAISTRQVTGNHDGQGKVRTQCRSKSPGPTPRTNLVSRGSSPEPTNRPKTPVNRCKSPGIPRAVLTTRAQSPEPSPRPKTPVYRSKSPGPIPKSALVTRAGSPDPNSGRALPSAGRTKSPVPFIGNFTGNEMTPENKFICKAPVAVRRAAPVERIIARANRQDNRPESPVSGSKSPGPVPRSRIPRSKSPFLRERTESSSMDIPRQGSTGDVPQKVLPQKATLIGNEPDSDEMDSTGDINIDQISTMTLSEFKNLLSTNLSVPNGNTTVRNSEATGFDSNKESVKSPNTKFNPNHNKSTPQKKPPASPRRTKSSSNLPATESLGHLPQDRQRRVLPLSPGDTPIGSLNGHTVIARQTSRDKFTSSSSDLSREAEPPSPTQSQARPVTPSSFSLLPRPRTPSGIPRASTPTQCNSGNVRSSREGKIEGTTKQQRRPSSPYRTETPRRSKTPEPMSNGIWIRDRSISPKCIIPQGKTRPQIHDSEPDVTENRENCIVRTTSRESRSDVFQSQNNEPCNESSAVCKPSRIRPPSPSRLPLSKRSVDAETDQTASRGRPATRTFIEQFRKRPSSAGPTAIASRYTKHKSHNSNDEESANGTTDNSVKKGFGRKNAKTIIKANTVLSKAKSIQHVDSCDEPKEGIGNLKGKSEENEIPSNDRSRSRTRSEGIQIRQRPKSAGPRPLVRQDAVDRSIIVSRRGAGQHSITITKGENKTYESREKQIRPSSAKASAPRSVICSSSNSISDRGRSRELSKSVDLTQRRYRPKSAGPRSASPVTPTDTKQDMGPAGVREKVSNRYVSTGNLVRAWEAKSSDKVKGVRRQLPPSPRKCVTPSPANNHEGRTFLRTRSVTPNPSDDHELEPRPLSEIKEALLLPINGISKIEVDPSKLSAPPEDPLMYQKMEELFQKYREKELNGVDIDIENGPDSASSTSEEVDREQGSADDEASVDSNSNIKSKLRNSHSESAIRDRREFDVNEQCDLHEEVRFEASVVAQLSEILKPGPRKELSGGMKSRIPAPQTRTRSKSITAIKSEQSSAKAGDDNDKCGVNSVLDKSVDCKSSRDSVNSQNLSVKPYEPRTRYNTCHSADENAMCSSAVDLHREDSSTSLSDISLSSSQGGFRSETPLPKLAQPLCTGRSTLFNTRKERSSSTSSAHGISGTRLVRAVSLDHSFTSTGNSLPDTSFSLAEDEEYV